MPIKRPALFIVVCDECSATLGPETDPTSDTIWPPNVNISRAGAAVAARIQGWTIRGDHFTCPNCPQRQTK